MVGIKILGQLGNHMFQYAFIYAVSKKLNTSFFIKYGSGKQQIPRLPEYFYLKNDSFFKNYFFSKLFSVKNKINLNSHSQPENELIKLEDNTIYEGFAQSEKYFSFIDLNVHEIFRIKNKYIRRFNQKYQSLFQNNKILVVHIRRGDYENSGANFLGGLDIRLPLDYYHHALNQIKDINDYKIIFISNEIDYCRKHFNHYKNCLFESNPEIIDLQLIINADAAVISNSTFAWWGAYLNKKKHKLIYSPNYWLGFRVKNEFPVGITSIKGWTWLEV